MRSEKMKAKYIKKYVWMSFFHKFVGWHLAASIQINVFRENFDQINTLQWLRLVLIQNAWKVSVKYLLCMLVEILQLLHEISSLPEVLYKKDVQKSFSKFRGKHIIRRCPVKKVLLKLSKNSQENPCTGVSL